MDSKGPSSTQRNVSAQHGASAQRKASAQHKASTQHCSSAQHQEGNTEIRVARRLAIDYHSGGFPSDYWHRTLKTKIVCQRPENCFPIFFNTNDSSALEPTLGVALTECEYGDGIEFPHTPLNILFPREVLREGPEGKLIITWPGYMHLKYKRTVYLHSTMGDLVSQITWIFKEFMVKHHADFKPPGIRLGPAFVTFQHLRLRKVYFNGLAWYLEMSYVYEKEPVWNII